VHYGYSPKIGWYKTLCLVPGAHSATMSLPFSKVDNIYGEVTLQEGYHTEIKLGLSEIAKVLESKENEIHLGGGKKFVISQTADDELVYCVKYYNADLSIRTSFSMDSDEWASVVYHATNITQPPVHDEICTYCDGYVPGEEHYGCTRNVDKIEAFVLTPLGERLTQAMVKAARDRYDMLMYGAEPGIDYNKLTRAYAYVKREAVADLMDINVLFFIENGPQESPNETILLYDSYFRNFKSCAYSHIIDLLNHDLGGDLKQELSLDWPEDFDM